MNLRFLTPKDVMMIDEALQRVGDFGEVHLLVSKGRLRFLVTQQSIDALRWQPGSSDERKNGQRTVDEIQ